MKTKHILKGMAMGIVETVPGVSSSTIAMLLGIYEDLITAISQLTTRKIKKALLFLIPIVIGIVIGAAFSVVSVKYLLETFPVPTHFLFMGLVLGMLPFIWRSGNTYQGEKVAYKGYHVVLIIIFFLLVASLSLVVDPAETVMSDLTIKGYIYLFFSGWLASIALVLPGISGALILMIVGAYYTALHALMTFDILVVLTLGMGVLIGILMTGKLVRLLLLKFRQSTYAAIVGLLAGSIIILYPGFPTQIIEFIVSILTFAIGFFFAWMISRR